MEIPLSLRKTPKGQLLYGIPLWYRAMTFVLLALVAGGMFSASGPPGVIGWVALVFLALGLLYEESWSIDSGKRLIRHSGGIWPFVRATAVDFDMIDEFTLQAFARGTVPDSPEEERENQRAFALLRGASGAAGEKIEKRSFLDAGRRKPYINLVLSTKNGEAFLIDTLPAQRAARLVKVGETFAQACQARFSQYEKPKNSAETGI